MDYEKKYKEALEKAHKLCAYPISKPFISDLQDLFPELKESEDEKIRKGLLALIEWSKSYAASGITTDDAKDMIAWLEKQGENTTTLPKWKYKKDNAPLLRDSIILNKYGCVAKSPSGALVSDVWVIDYDELAKLPKEEFEKQGEQNLANSAKTCKDEQKPVVIIPKFKIGDNIKTANEEPLTITKIDDKGYWSEDLFICGFEDITRWELVEQNPAEVRTGYLNVQYAEQKPTDNKMKEILRTEYEKGRADAIEEMQKTAWSEEDENCLSDALWCCKQAASIAKDENDMGNVWFAENWLKSIKEKVQPQPKQEWSEEDENNILFLTSIIEECFKDKEKITLYGDTVCANFTKEDVIDRLKSLRPHSQWKPSEGQMKALDAVIDEYDGYPEFDLLVSLKNDLNNLKG